MPNTNTGSHAIPDTDPGARAVPYANAGTHTRTYTDSRANTGAMPDTHAMTPEIRDVAREVAEFCARKTVTSLSDISHKNPGWDIAWKEGQRKGCVRPINMLIAMQQIVDDDPWMQRPLDEAERAACERADVAGSQTW